MTLTQAILTVRDSVVAVFRYREVRPQHTKKGKTIPARFNVGWGSGFCVVADRFVATAFHVLKEGQSRSHKDRFVVLVVPGNGDPAFHFPVTGFPIERPDLDMAVLEIGPCATAGIHLPSIPVSFPDQQDGARVLTVGFPAPEVTGVSIDPQGEYRGGQFFLKVTQTRASYPPNTDWVLSRSMSSTSDGTTVKAAGRSCAWMNPWPRSR